MRSHLPAIAAASRGELDGVVLVLRKAAAVTVSEEPKERRGEGSRLPEGELEWEAPPSRWRMKGLVLGVLLRSLPDSIARAECSTS